MATETALMYLNYDIHRVIALAGGVQPLIFLPIPQLHSGTPIPV